MTYDSLECLSASRLVDRLRLIAQSCGWSETRRIKNKGMRCLYFLLSAPNLSWTLQCINGRQRLFIIGPMTNGDACADADSKMV